jgi:hypothetical protein
MVKVANTETWTPWTPCRVVKSWSELGFVPAGRSLCAESKNLKGGINQTASKPLKLKAF